VDEVVSDLVALVNNRGASEANVDCVSYAADVEGIFHVPAEVAQALIALPAGFAAAPDEQPPLETSMTRDFLALTPAGEPWPGARFEVGVGGRYEADEHGIITNVLPNHASNLLNAGAVPLPPAGWVDPRPTK
jgi:hypothetical protein